ncbi:MAG: hypothetical protein H7257_07120 [Taibaiella sp.]|nr:hypothetical protein [Taibaiella sp.]
MSEAEIMELRKEAKKYIDNADERALKMVYAMLEADAKNEDTFSLTPQQDAELNEILELDKKGLLGYSSWSDVKQRIISNKK